MEESDGKNMKKPRKKESKEETFTMRMDRIEREMLEDLAKREERSAGQVVRRLIRKAYEDASSERE